MLVYVVLFSSLFRRKFDILTVPTVHEEQISLFPLPISVLPNFLSYILLNI